ncbi:MAG: ABC transporter permease [Armatimonadetes bacterium]|nr:ABC transporter permease [Armatimonadota bacterium]
MTALLRTSLRFARGHPLQVALLVLGVALGVAVVVAVDLATASARASFASATETVSGRATHQVVAPAGVTVDVYRRLKLTVPECAPVVTGTVTVVGDGHAMRILGVDPFAEAPFRGYVPRTVPDLGGFLTRPGAVFAYGRKPGDVLRVAAGGRVARLVVVGTLTSADLADVLLCDVSTAQEILGMTRLSHVDLRLEHDLENVRALLPPDARLESARQRAEGLQRMTAAFELNLTAISLLVLVVGMFLIYNTITFFVVQRRPQLGILRALGATQGEIFVLVLAETCLLGAAGALLGLALGVALGKGALSLVTRTINDLYYTVPAGGLLISPWLLLKGILLGVGAAAISAVPPALEAARVAPAGVLSRSELERKAGRVVRWATAVGAALLLAAGGLLLAPGRRLDFAFVALALGLLGAAFMVGLLGGLLMRAVTPLATFLGGAPAAMAPRAIARNLSRTAVAMAALMLAVSSIVGVQIMVGSFRATFEAWLDVTLAADIFVSSPYNRVSHAEGFSRAVAGKIRSVPGVARVETARNVPLETPAYGHIQLFAVSDAGSQGHRLAAGSIDGFSSGSVLVSEPFSWRNGIKPGDTITLPGANGPVQFPVTGVFHDYATERGAVMISDDRYRRHWREPLITSVAVAVAPGANVEEVAERVRARVAGAHLQVRSQKGVRALALTVFDRTFAITSALRVLVAVAAFIGVLSSLMALLLERVREIGLLRALGMTVGQVWRLVLLETALISSAAGLLALPVGAGLAAVLVDAVHPRSFGWTLAFVPRVSYFVEAFVLALSAGLLAAIYPASRFAAVPPGEALRTE